MVAGRLGLTAALADLNRGPREHRYRDSYSEATRRQVARFYGMDLEVFGYRF